MSTEEFGCTNREIYTALPHAQRDIALETPVNPYGEVMQRFAESVAGKGKPVADGVDGLREVQLANGIYVSGWEERRVTLPVEETRYLEGLQSRQKAERSKN